MTLTIREREGHWPEVMLGDQVVGAFPTRAGADEHIARAAGYAAGLEEAAKVVKAAFSHADDKAEAALERKDSDAQRQWAQAADVLEATFVAIRALTVPSEAAGTDYAGEPSDFDDWYAHNQPVAEGEIRDDILALTVHKFEEQRARAEVAEARVKELAEVLEPFVDQFNKIEARYVGRGGNLSHVPDDAVIGEKPHLTYGDFRRARTARAAIKSHPDEDQ